MLQNRWRPLSEALARYDSSVLEAEARWGGPASQQTDRLRRCAITVFVATEAPLTHDTPALTHHSCAIARFRLMCAKASGRVQLDHHTAVKFFVAVQAGKYSLRIADDGGNYWVVDGDANPAYAVTELMVDRVARTEKALRVLGG